MADATLAVPKILKWEGGWADNPNDPGGATMEGITLNTFIGYRLKNNLPRPSKDDLRNISDQEWFDVFKQEFWDDLRADEINNQSDANLAIDWFWMSWHAASKGIQRTVGVYPDGEIGDESIAAINAMDPEELFHAMKAARIAYYETIIRKNPHLETFRDGWTNRLNDYTYEP